EQLLALHPEADAAVDLLGRRVGGGQEDDGAGVVLGLHQAGDELHLIGADDGGGLVQPDIELEPSGQDVAVRPPPARYVGLAGQYEQLFAFGLVNDPVQGEQIGYIALPDTAAATLQAAELGLARPDRLGRLPGGKVTGFPEPTQLRAERDPRRRRPAARVGERPPRRPPGPRP